MRLRQVLCIVIGLTCGFPAAEGRFWQQQTKQVPIERLFANLQQKLARNSDDFEGTYQLARLHSMAFSTNLVEFPATKSDETPVFYSPGDDPGVPRGVSLPPDEQAQKVAFKHLTNAIALYDRAILLLKKSTNAASQSWLILPTELGRAWCLDQAGRRQEALDAYRKTLKIAWKKEVTGDFDLKEWINDRWNDIRAGKLPTRNSRRGFIGPGVCYSQEVIGYMLKLLDPVKDAREIAELKKDQQTLLSARRAVTPILVPLEPDALFSSLVDVNSNVRFDLDGSGVAQQWGWIAPKAAWLVWDFDGSGRITSGLQMFGNVTFWIFWRDGYAALAALDSDGDGVLKGPELRGLSLWHDRNSNGISDPGEVQPLTVYGITAIDCANRLASDGMSWNPRGVMFMGGDVRPTYDWLGVRR